MLPKVFASASKSSHIFAGGTAPAVAQRQLQPGFLPLLLRCADFLHADDEQRCDGLSVLQNGGNVARFHCRRLWAAAPSSFPSSLRHVGRGLHFRDHAGTWPPRPSPCIPASPSRVTFPAQLPQIVAHLAAAAFLHVQPVHDFRSPLCPWAANRPGSGFSTSSTLRTRSWSESRRR